MPADRLTLYYSGRDPSTNRRRAAKTVSIGCESKFNHRLFGGGHLLRLQLRKGGPSSYRPQDGLARRALLTKVATSRAAASQPRQDLPIVHDFVISRPSGKPALALAFAVAAAVFLVSFLLLASLRLDAGAAESAEKGGESIWARCWQGRCRSPKGTWDTFLSALMS